MMKIITTLAIMFIMAASPASKAAGQDIWQLECSHPVNVDESDSVCVAAAGLLKVSWSGDKLTGVEGLPIAVEDFEAAEKKIEKTMEKTLTKKQHGGSEVSVGTPALEGSGVKGSSGGSKEKAFAKKRSITQSKTGGDKTTINYTLAFVKWLGDTRYAGYGFRGYRGSRYVYAAQAALGAYYDGTIDELC